MSAEDVQRALAAFDPEALPPGATVLQRGRNLVVRADLAGTDAVVKFFPAPSPLRALLERLAGRPPKAERAFRAARFLEARAPGLTPAPLGVAARPGGGGLFATKFEPGLVSFTARLAAIYRAGGPCPELIALLRRVARACRALHDAGFLHGDLGNQNIALAPDGRTLFVDLNRARLFPDPLSPRRRARDLSRIALPSDFLRVFFEMYWEAPPPRAFLEAERAARRAFAWHTATRRLRHPLRRRAPSPEPVYPAPPDIWIWDPKSEQAVSTMRSRDRRRWMSHTRVTRAVDAILRDGPAARRRLRILRGGAFQRPVLALANRVFVSVSADPDRFGRELEHLARLDGPGVHVRFYAHDPDETTAFRIDAVRRLRALGRAVAISLVQDRARATDPEAWRAFCERVLDALHGEVIWVEYLHAVNRVKWGIWNFRELGRLFAVLPALRGRYRDVSFLGPSTIDFEWDFFAAALRMLPAFPGPLAGVSAELYVDRRGAPENKQGRFDALGKLALLRAFAMGCPNVEDHLVVTEFNWPLAGTGEWSPVGSPYVSPGPRGPGDPSVPEEDAAAFTVRYLLLGLCSGLADEMVVWSLAAHGFGLVDPGTAPEPSSAWRERPAFLALRQLFAALRHGNFTDAPQRGDGPDGAWLLRFLDRDGRRLAVAWTTAPRDADAPTPALLGFEPREARDLYGAPVLPFHPISGRPVYYYQ